MTAVPDDVTRNRLGMLLWYGAPILVIMIAPVWISDPLVLGFTWFSGFAVMGGRCLWNARTCRRTHCYFTGPWFLATALASLALGFTAARPEVWRALGTIAAIGAGLLWFGSERVFGKYLRDDAGA